MKIDIADYSVYGNRIDASSDALIRSSAEKLGFNVTMIELAKNKDQRRHSPFVWLRYDLRCRDDLVFICDRAAFLEAKGCRVFPSPSSIILAEDKWETFSALRSAGIATVDSFRFDNFPTRGGPIVVKPRVGWGGRGIRLIEGTEEMEGIALEERDSFIGQPYIAHDRTFTVAAGGGRVIATLRTDSHGGDFRSNCSEGAPPVFDECPPEMASLATGALEAIGLAAGSVDIIENEGTHMVLEVNSAPRLHYETFPGLDLAGPMVDIVTAGWRNNS